MFTRKRWSGFVIVLVLVMQSHFVAYAQTERRCFPETGFCIEGRIRAYWEQNGGLPVFGYPITEQRSEVIEGQTVQAQWFERNRLELHPENQPPYDVLLGRLAGAFVAASGAPGRESPQEGCTYFEETGFNVCGDILAAWQAQGLELDGRAGKITQESLALFGYPLTGQFEMPMSDGKVYTVQWFERARFELHPENTAPSNVLLGRLGVEAVGEPSSPTANDEQQIKSAVRTFLGDPGFAYTVEVRCIDRNFATAGVTSDAGDIPTLILSKRDGQWTFVAYVSASLFEDGSSTEMGIPADFACLTP